LNLATPVQVQICSNSVGLQTGSTIGRFPAMTCYIAVRMHKLKVGDLVQAELSGGRVVEATVMAVINKTDGTRLQVSFGHETALIYLWQVVKTNSANTDTRKSR
jgi:hypothetical protein